ncbi:hypothetical protein B0H17DRAFT_1217925 [Mycena rosella]|uniref:Uncharacterized protein n=1 Tax=Mycena rosella TaxID=1033263 RepID=A0AAD7BUZ4_MYCRO|nr:hypothetical protein B0H17DRAFT_1217925 [Mycena rosella]
MSQMFANSVQSTVQWSVTKNTVSSLIYPRVINTTTASNTVVVFTLPFTIPSDEEKGGPMNTPTNRNAAVPKAITFIAGKTITYVAPALSALVLIVNAH